MTGVLIVLRRYKDNGDETIMNIEVAENSLPHPLLGKRCAVYLPKPNGKSEAWFAVLVRVTEKDYTFSTESGSDIRVFPIGQSFRLAKDRKGDKNDRRKTDGNDF